VPGEMREQRLVFGEDAELYDRARPSYPAALVDTVIGLVGEQARALDVGCGTGKATRLLAERGLSGVAVEPDRSMAAVAERLLAPFERWKVEISDFETWDPGPTEADFDLVCCAQAWHWLDPRQRLPKARDLLRSGGWLALWWNRPAEDNSDIGSALDDVYQRLAPELPARGIGSRGSPEIDTVDPGLGFDRALVRAFEWSGQYTDEQWVDLLRTQSDHRLMSGDRQGPLLDAIRTVIQDNGGLYRHPYTTWLWTTQKTG
jgi:SAM-dependent methyltransferase